MISSLKKKYRHRIFELSRKYLGAGNTRTLGRFFRRRLFWFRRAPYLNKLTIAWIPGSGVLVSGNCYDINRQIQGLDLRLTDGSALSLDDVIVWRENEAELKKYGFTSRCGKPWFAAYLQTAKSGAANKIAGVTVRLRNGRSRALKCAVLDAGRDPLGTIKRVLQFVPANMADKRGVYDSALGPALGDIWQLKTANRPGDRGANGEVVCFNEHRISSNPAVSLIIPIYGRYDFIEYQLSQFVNDPDISRHELVYVVDDPRLTDEIRNSATALAKIYDIGFRIVFLPENLGYAGANNRGAEHARGRDLLLLNSDVLPSESGWITKMATSRAPASIVGARLLYEDGSIQHEGMRFYPSPFHDYLWLNLHPGKGMPADLIPQSGSLLAQEAVTGACLLIGTEEYRKLGGLDEGYVLGDFEDSDLCMAARAQGFEIYLNNQVVMYHLERLSQSLVEGNHWKQELTYYNCWRHTRRWDASINTMKAGNTCGSTEKLAVVVNG